MHVCAGMVILQEVHFKNITLKIKAVHFVHPLPSILQNFIDQTSDGPSTKGGIFASLWGRGQAMALLGQIPSLSQY